MSLGLKRLNSILYCHQKSLTSTWCCMYSFWAPDDEWKNRSKHVQRWQQ